MSIVPINIGSASNDGNGQNLRSGGQVINANFAELDQRTTAAQSAADAAQAKADTAQAKADAAIPSLQKGQPNGVAGLDGSGTVPASQLPSYVDDVLEFGSFSALPAAGETGKIYITTDTNSQYRWSGTQYVLLTASPGSTDAVPEGAVNKYWTLARTLGSALAGLVTTNPAVIAATDTVLAAFGKLQRQITDLTASVANKAGKGANSDITSLTGLTTPLSIAQGGNGGSAISIVTGGDANNITNPGVYAFGGGGLNLPTASAAYYLRVAIYTGLIIQEALGMTAVLNGKNYTRVFNGTAWSAWVPYAPVQTKPAWGDITGTLSAQADLQTALSSKLSIVGSGGTNLNGWVKYSDGTIEQWGTVSVASTAAGVAFSFNTPFLTVVKLLVTTSAIDGRGTTGEANNTALALNLSQFKIASGHAATPVNINWYAKGI